MLRIDAPRPRVASLVLVAASMVGHAASAQIFSGHSIDVGAFPEDVDAIDFDSDGDLDLVVACWGTPGHISVVMSAGPTTFSDPVNYPAHDALSVAVADYDADGDLDVAAATSETTPPFGPALTFYLGAGSGGLVLASTVPTAFDTGVLQAGDLDSDGLPDLAAASAADGVVEVSLNQGGASFWTFAPVGSFSAPLDMVVADANADGALDVVVADGPDRVLVLHGTGTGTFPTSITTQVCGVPAGVTLGDFTQDGLVDFASTCSTGAPYAVPSAAAVGLYAATTAGGYAAQAVQDIAPYGSKLARGDVDGDGRLDLAVATYVDYAILLGTPGGLAPPSYWAGAYAGNGAMPSDVELVDLDGDAMLDLVGVDSELRIDRGLGGGAIEGARVWKYGPEGALPLSGPFPKPRDVIAVDLDGNGAPDLVAPQFDGKVVVLPTDGAGMLRAPAEHAAPTHLAAAHVGQIDGDGDADVFLVSSSAPAIHSYLGDGSGGLSAASSFPLPFDPVDSVAGDLDGDGDADVAAAVGSAIVVAHADSGGLTGSSLSLPFANPSPLVLTSGDLNADGLLDLVGMGFEYTSGGLGFQFTDPRYRVFLGTPAGGFVQLGPFYGLDLAPTDLETGDVDADGHLDMLALGTFETTFGAYFPRLRRYRGTGSGTFTGVLDVAPASGNTSYLWVGDLNGDGAADALAGGSQDVEFFRSKGTSGFAAPTAYLTGAGSMDGDLVDLDADGWLDLVRATTSGSPWWWQRGISVLQHVGAPAAGASAYGTGTPGCSGTLGLGVNSTPAIGNTGFAIVASGVAPSALGSGYFALAADPSGSDPFSLGLILHLDPLAGGPLVSFEVKSGTSGTAIAKLPIPFDPQLVNAVVYAQEFWLPPPWQACGDAAFGLVSSRGMRLTIQP